MPTECGSCLVAPTVIDAVDKESVGECRVGFKGVAKSSSPLDTVDPEMMSCELSEVLPSQNSYTQHRDLINQL